MDCSAPATNCTAIGVYASISAFTVAFPMLRMNGQAFVVIKASKSAKILMAQLLFIICVALQMIRNDVAN